VNEGQAKKTRRDLRRAVGVEAVGVIEAHTGRLSMLEIQARAQAGLLSDHARELIRLSGESAASGDVMARLTSVVYTRTFWGRMRWLLTGR